MAIRVTSKTIENKFPLANLSALPASNPGGGKPWLDVLGLLRVGAGTPLGTLATQSANIADYLTIASAALSYQPLDADLTALAALATTTYGRSLLTQADASATRTTLGLGTSATLNAGSANGVATLGADSKLTAAQIPDISLISYLGSVASQAAMLALTGQQGDWCVRSDLSTTWVITGSDPSLLANWTQLSYPSAPVQSVHGRTGAVVGVSTDYSAVGITNTAIGASNPSTGAFTTLSVNSPSGNTVPLIAKYPSGTLNVGLYSSSNSESYIYDYANGSGLYLGNRGQFQFGIAAANGGSNHRVFLSSGCGLSWCSTPYADFTTVELSLYRDAANTLAQRNGTNQQRFNLYGTYTDGANYRRLYLDSTTAGAFTIGVEGAGTGASGNTLTVANALSLSGPLTVNSNSNSQFVGTNSKWEIDIDSPGEGGKLNYLSYNTRRLIISGRSDQPFIKWWNISSPSFIGQGAGDGYGDVGFSFYQQTITASAKSGYTTVPVNLQINGNTSIADTWNSNVSVTGASGNGTTATLTFSAMTTAFPIGSTIVVTSVNPSGYNGTFTVTASTTTSVSYANATTGAYVSGGNIKQLFTALKLNVTDTSSDAGSLLADFQVGGTSKVSIRKTGAIVFGGSDGTSIDPAIVFPTGYSSTFKIATDINNGIAIVAQGYTTYVGNSIKVTADTSVALRWTLGAATKLAMHYDADNTLAQRNGTSAQAFRLYRTADGSPGSNYQRLALSSTTYSGAFYQTILCESAGTGGDNINLVLGPKGTGAILAQVPDGTATGGNARGQYAVDLQMNRGAANAVASGNYSVIPGGQSNSCTGQFSFSGGTGTACSGDSSFAFGYQAYATNSHTVAITRQGGATGYMGCAIGGIFNLASGEYSLVGSGYSNTASGTCSVAVGYKTIANRMCQYSFGGGAFATNGDAQKVEIVLRKKTTDATPTSLMIGDDTQRLTIPSGKVFAFVAKISGIKSDGSAVAFYTRKGAIKNVGGTTSLVGSIETIGTDTEDNASTDVAITADDTNDALQINVTGIASETWRWVAVVEGVEIGYGT